jgi:hypothetical protein
VCTPSMHSVCNSVDQLRFPSRPFGSLARQNVIHDLRPALWPLFALEHLGLPHEESHRDRVDRATQPTTRLRTADIPLTSPRLTIRFSQKRGSRPITNLAQTFHTLQIVAWSFSGVRVSMACAFGGYEVGTACLLPAGGREPFWFEYDYGSDRRLQTQVVTKDLAVKSCGPNHRTMCSDSAWP